MTTEAASTTRRDLWVTLIALAALLAWEVSGLDLAIARAFGNAHGFAWRDQWLTAGVLHGGGRWLAWGVLALLAGDALQPKLTRAARRERWYWIGVILACTLLVPGLKRLTHTSCPWDLSEFGGVAAYVPHWQWSALDGGPGHCFPSGHAVAAFAFLGIYFGSRHHRPRLARAGLVLVCVAGAVFGWAQLARGAHYVSHTLWSAWLCWALCVLATRLPRPSWWSRRAPAGAAEPLSRQGPTATTG